MKRFNNFLKVLLCSAFLSTGFALVAFEIGAEPMLYYTDDISGVPPGTTPQLPLGGTPTIHLWFNPGPTPNATGTICDDGNGDDSCGIHFKITVNGDLGISNFQFEPEYAIAQMSATSTEVNASIVATDPADILPANIPTKVATFDLDASNPQGGLGEVTFLQSVDADLELVANGIVGPVFFVPEPAVALQLTAGALGLAALNRRRLNQQGRDRDRWRSTHE
jgi:hypothetical protein